MSKKIAEELEELKTRELISLLDEPVDFPGVKEEILRRFEKIDQELACSKKRAEILSTEIRQISAVICADVL